METIGDRVRNLRIKKNLTQNELAKKLHINQSVLHRIEKNTRKLKDYEIENLSIIFNVSVDYLINGKEEDTEEDELIKLLIQKTIDRKIKWVNGVELSEIEPIKVGNQDVTTDDLILLLEEYIDIDKHDIDFLANFLVEIDISFTGNTIFIFSQNDDINELFFGTPKRLDLITDNKNLETLGLAIYKPFSFVDPAKIESAITDLKNL